jgi:tetratricopeptide (TPR) repeat protein
MSNVDHIAFAPDGKTLATGGEDHTVRLWDTATGQEKATLKAHADVVRGLAFSRDGSLLATGSSDGAIRLWQTSRELEATDVATEFDVEKAGSLAALIDAASRLNLTARLTDAGQIHEEALARLEKMASVFPNDDRHGQLLARGRNQLANLLVVAPDANVRDARRALELARQAVAVDPQSWVYRHTLGVAHYRAGNWTEAATELEKAMQSGWPDWFVSFFPAMSYWKSGRKEQAREAYKHAAGIMDKYYPDSERYVRQRAEAAELLGLPLASASPSLPPAVTNGTKSAQRAAGWGANRYGLGKWFYEQGRFAEAEPYFREAEAEFRESIRLNPESANPQLGLGLALCEQKKFSDAIAPLREAIRLQSTQGQPPGEWYKLLGWALLSIGQPVEAEAVFREQVRVTTAAELGAGFKLSDHTLAWYSLALARVLAGNLPGYEALARQISEGFRGLEDRHVISACLLRAEGAADSAELLRWARQAYEAKRDHMTAYNLGLAHYRAGEFEPALEHIEEARTTADWFLSWPALAMTHHRLAQGGMAREWLDKAEAVFRDRTGVFRDRTEPKGERLKYMDEHPWWLDWTYFEVMLLEARQVIGSEESK